MTSNRDTGYHTTLKIAQAALRERDIGGCCRLAGATWQAQGEGVVVEVPYFQDLCEITLPDYSCLVRGSESGPGLGSQILILHYLNGVRDVPLEGKYISFMEVPSGSFYYAAFVRRTITPLLRTFGHDPEALIKAAHTLGGTKVALGDLGVCLSVFPRVPITLVYWQGDAELAAELQMLFDASIVKFLATEDIAVLGQEVMLRMVRQYRA